MATLQEEVQTHINKLTHPLKDEEELREVLKAKLTKKEFKLLYAWAEGADIEALKTKLNLDKPRYEALASKLVKKLNQERIKQAMYL